MRLLNTVTSGNTQRIEKELVGNAMSSLGSVSVTVYLQPHGSGRGRD